MITWSKHNTKHKNLISNKQCSQTHDIFRIKHKEHHEQLYRTNQISKVGTTSPKKTPQENQQKHEKKHVETYEFYHRKWARTHWDSRSGRATRTMAAYLHEKNRAEIQNSE